MNVSSVKNLNGEVLSAVQDASLTNVIQTNSGNWQDITAYQNASSTYLTEVSIPESATWNEVSTTVQTNSAQWAEGGSGDDEVNALVHSNSGNWNTVTDKLDTSSFINIINNFYPASNPAGYITGVDLSNYYTKDETSGKEELANALAGGSEFPISADEAIQYVQTNSGTIDDTITNVNTNSGAWGGSALPISAGPGIKLEMVDNTLVFSTNTNGYLWQSASLFHTDTPVTQTTYTLSNNCSNYDRLDVDFYDINDWRTVMECPIPSNLDASGTRGGYFSVVPENTSTGANIWFKAFNWTAAGTTWSCYCSELAGKGGSTTQTINANEPYNPPKVVNIIGWKRVGGN